MKNKNIINRDMRKLALELGWSVKPETEGAEYHQTGVCNAINKSGDVELRVSNETMIDLIIAPGAADLIVAKKVNEIIEEMKNDFINVSDNKMNYVYRHANPYQLQVIIAICENE